MIVWRLLTIQSYASLCDLKGWISDSVGVDCAKWALPFMGFFLFFAFPEFDHFGFEQLVEGFVDVIELFEFVIPLDDAARFIEAIDVGVADYP